MSTYLGHPVYDYFMHQPAVQDYPSGRGTRTTTAGSGIAPLGKKVILHSCFPMNGYTSGAGGFVNITNGDGSVTYFAMAAPANVNGMTASLDVELFDGLGASGGAGGPWLIAYRVIE